MKKRRRLTEEEKLLNKYLRKLEGEAFMKSIIVGFACGCTVSIPISIIAFITVYNTLWIALGVLGAVTIIATFVAYFKYYRTNIKKTALRVDGAGLEERVITMLEYADRDDALAVRQRADAREALEKLDTKAVKIPFPKTPIIMLAVSLVLSVGMIVASTLTVQRIQADAEDPSVEDPIETEEDKIIREMIEALRKEIKDAKVSDGLKEKLNGMVDDLENRLRPEDSLSVKIVKISETAQEIHRLIQEELMETAKREALTRELKSHETTKGIGVAIDKNDKTILKTEFDKISENAKKELQNQNAKPIITTALDILNSLVDAGFELDEETYEIAGEFGFAAPSNKPTARAAAKKDDPSAADMIAEAKCVDDMAKALEKLARELLSILMENTLPDGSMPDDAMQDILDQIQDAFDNAFDEISDAMDSLDSMGNLDDAMQDIIQDALENLGKLPDEDDPLKDPIEGLVPDLGDIEGDGIGAGEEEVEGPSYVGDDGNLVYDSVIDGQTPYDQVIQDYQDQLRDMLENGNLTDEERRVIENYFDILK